MGCVPVPDTGDTGVSETCCGNSGYRNNTTVIRGMMRAQNNSGPGGVDAPFVQGLTTREWL